MKKIILVLIILSGAICSSSQVINLEDLALISEFKNSPDLAFLMQDTRFANMEINDGESYLKREEETKKPVVYLALQNKSTKKVMGYFEAAKASREYTRIPNRGTYFVIWRDYSQFNLEEGYGLVEYYDANYDFYLAGRVSLTPSGTGNWTVWGMPDDIRRKYSYGNNYNLIEPGPERKHFCDSNNNGDVSFGECYKCLKDACNSDPECHLLCDFFRIRCRTSMRISCAILAIIY